MNKNIYISTLFFILHTSTSYLKAEKYDFILPLLDHASIGALHAYEEAEDELKVAEETYTKAPTKHFKLRSKIAEAKEKLRDAGQALAKADRENFDFNIFTDVVQTKFYAPDESFIWLPLESYKKALEYLEEERKIRYYQQALHHVSLSPTRYPEIDTTYRETLLKDFFHSFDPKNENSDKQNAALQILEAINFIEAARDERNLEIALTTKSTSHIQPDAADALERFQAALKDLEASAVTPEAGLSTEEKLINKSRVHRIQSILSKLENFDSTVFTSEKPTFDASQNKYYFETHWPQALRWYFQMPYGKNKDTVSYSDILYKNKKIVNNFEFIQGDIYSISFTRDGFNIRGYYGIKESDDSITLYKKIYFIKHDGSQTDQIIRKSLIKKNQKEEFEAAEKYCATLDEEAIRAAQEENERIADETWRIAKDARAGRMQAAQAKKELELKATTTQVEADDFSKDEFFDAPQDNRSIDRRIQDRDAYEKSKNKPWWKFW